MKFKKWTSVVVMTLFAALMMPVWTAAQDNPSKDHNNKHHHYKLIDLGTLGGPQSIVTGLTRPLNNQGVVTSCADTSILDPNNPQNPFFFQPNYPGGLDPYIQHAFRWQNGVLSDLGTLPGGTSSCTEWINERGVIVGGATNGAIDPLTGYPEVNAALWKNGTIRNLGTLGGNESVAFGLNNRGQAAGFALNTIPDLYTNVFAFGATQAHAFLWQDGVMQDLGTLGGPDSIAYYVNDRGQVAGQSFTNSTPNPSTGVPTLDPFLWEDGNMLDLGTLGGTFSVTNDLNNRGQVVGNSNLAGDTAQHPFLWDPKKGLIDLGTFGGSNGSAQWLNDAGEVVGQANLPGDTGHDAFLWKNGVLTDLGNLGKTSSAEGINSSGQIVGGSRINSTTVHGFLWENGGPMVDLNSLILPGSALTSTFTWSINDRGEITGVGQLANGDVHAILLIPCDEEHPGECEDYSMIEVSASQISVPTAEFSAPATQNNESPEDTVNPVRNRFGRGFHIPGQPAVPSN
jgi:probable HAF family extracellular repeat protein